MKANELMTGFLVYFNCFDGSKIVVRVTGFENGIVHSVSEKGLHWCNIANAEPIPLTPEILERLGCFTVEKVPKYDDAYTDDEYTATMKYTDARKCEVEIEYNTYWKNLMAFNFDPRNRLPFTSIEAHIEYVHELQHILRVLKVDKELELLN
jgi:hypothetical protein